MTAALSIYLDALRFIAALAVVWNHMSGQRFSGGLLWQLGADGHEAVLFFFVLSGLVIGFVTATKENDPRNYALSRLARMYSVVIPALLLTCLADTLGGYLGGGL